jgi:predicted nucleic acid-binding protein
MYLIDTNVLSEARRGTSEARRWLRSVDSGLLYVSVITLGEIMKGVALRQRSDSRAAGRLAEWLQQLRQEYADRVLPVSDLVALEWGRFAAQRPRGMADALLAATAAVHNKIVVTRNSTDFVDTGVPVINPWQL